MKMYTKVIAGQEAAIDVGGSMVASFTLNTFEGLVNLFYKNSDELSYKRVCEGFKQFYDR